MDNPDITQLDIDYSEAIRPIHYKFRFTFTEQDDKHEYTKEDIARFKAISRNIKAKFVENYTITKMTGGMETLNKKGERTYAHVHLHFDALENKESMARTIKRYLTETYDQNTTGVKAFCFKPDVVRNMDDFYRYPLKQNLDTKLCHGFPVDKLNTMYEIAKSTYEKVVQVNQTKMDRSDNSDTLFQKLKYIFEKEDIQQKKPLLFRATKFYIDEDKPINRHTIQGYVDNYMLSKGYITFEEYWGNPN